MNASIRSSSVVLVSGGGRGITARCVVKLAERFQCRFILLGRSSIEGSEPDWAKGVSDAAELKKRILGDVQSRGEKASPQKVQGLYKALVARREIEGTLEDVRRVGGQAEYLRVDVTDDSRLAPALAGVIQRLGPVTGLIHGAGNLADKLIEKKTAADFETVYTPKVDGLENLLASISPEQLDFLVLFSSVAGFYGNVGQADYAMANEVLNKTAHLLQRRYPRCRVVSIDWGPWEAGMVTPELKKLFSERHIDLIPVEAGANLLAETLVSPSSGGVQVIVGTPPVRPAVAFDPELRQTHIRRRLSLAANPFLQDHVIGEHPVLPATCAASWMIHASEQLYPGYTAFSARNFRVLKGIVFNENLADETVLDLKEVSKTPEEIVLDALVWSKTPRGRVLYHYGQTVTLKAHIPPAPPAFSGIVPDIGGEVVPGSVLYKDGTLFHGPSFQGVDQLLHIRREGLVMRCRLAEVPAQRQGQFPVRTLNPYIYDAIVQCLLIWSQHFYQAPCLPSRMKELEQYRPVLFDQPYRVEMKIHSETESSVVGDITVQDEEGRLCLHIRELEGTISKHLARRMLHPLADSAVPTSDG